MDKESSPEKSEGADRSVPQQVSGDSYVVQNLNRSVAAIGDGASVVYHQALSGADEARDQEDYEGEKLAQAVANLAKNLSDQANTPPPESGSPYKYLLPYELADVARFFGRDRALAQTLENLTCSDSRCRLAVLHGDIGMGKTSLLQAGIAPALIAAQHLPLLVRVGEEPLVATIKHSLLPDLDRTPMLKNAPLAAFLRQVTGRLPPGKQAYVLLDRFELILKQPPDARREFLSELANCLFDRQLDAHWLISLRSAWLGYLATFEPAIPTPYLSNQIALPPLTAREARQAILEPAQLRGIEVDADLLATLLHDLGDEAVDPARLQLVCHTLVEGLAPGERQLSKAAYERAGQVPGVLRDHLELVVSRHLRSQDREAAWQLLVVLAGRQPEGGTSAELAESMQAYGLARAETNRLLDILEDNRLVRTVDERYILSGEGLVEPIREWAARRAAAVQAREEAQRQVASVRRSALRGLLGGGLGFALAYLITYYPQVNDPTLLTLLTIYRSLPGAIAGVLLVLSVDLAVASYHGPRRWMRWLVAGLGGAGSFALALAFHKLLDVPGDLLSMVLVVVQGLGWGLLSGLGAIWALESRRPAWLTVPIAALAGGLALGFGETFGRAFQRLRLGQAPPGIIFLVVLAGAIMTAFVLLAALVGVEERHPQD